MQELQGWRIVCEQPPDSNRDWSLLAAAQRGDSQALENLIYAHKGFLFRLCITILGNAEDAEDAVQDTFVRTLRALSGFRRDAGFRTWLTRIAVNVCKNVLRDRQRNPRAEIDVALLSQDARSPEDEAVERMGIREALGTIPADLRIVLLLKEAHGMSVEEIASIQRCTRRRIYYELALAHKALAEWRRASSKEERE